MSSKIQSISIKLVSFTILFTLILPLVFWSVLYFSLKHGLSKQDEEVLQDRMHALTILLQADRPPWERLRSRVEREWLGRNFERIFARVVARDGTVLTETPNLEPEQKSMFGELKTDDQRLLGGERGIYRTGVREANDAAGSAYLIQIAMERTNEQRLLANFRNSFWVLLLIGGVASLWASRAVVRIALQPIRHVTELAANVTSDRLNERIQIEALPLELRELGLTLNRMLDRLHESFDRLSKFSEDMAHELRTPLNNLLGSMSVALTRERANGEYRNLIGSSIEECERLKRIIDSLLFIARTADPKQKIEKQQLRLEDEMKDIVSFYQVSAEEKNIAIELAAEGQIPMLAERTLLQRCVGNLLSNSIRHSPNDSKIQLNIGREDGEVFIQVRDFGCGIPKSALSQVGERFFKADPSRSQSSSGTGLGLSIVKGILNVHGGRLQIESELSQGTTVTLRFPG
jgi:two-component system heavy metal sensor histidine kinase CusS